MLKQRASSAAIASASAGQSLRNPASPPIQRIPLLAAAAEVLDSAGRPICLMPQLEVEQQRLPHRKAVILALAPNKSMLLALGDSGAYTFTAQSIPPAGASIEEAALESLRARIGFPAPLRLVGEAKRPPAAVFLFAARCSFKLLKALESDRLLSTCRAEIEELRERGLIDPLLAELLHLF